MSTRSVVAKTGVVAAWSAGFAWQFAGAWNDLALFLDLAARSQSELSGFAWSVLGAGLAIPVAGLVLGAVLGARRRARSLALVLLAAFCASGALGLSVLAVFQQGAQVR